MIQRLKQALLHRQKRHIVDTSLVAAAVLVPIFCEHGQYYILFTRRTDKVKEHKGEISFPGGAYEEGDGTLLNTALRESAEEICLMADEVEILGELDDTLTTVSSYIITPFVAFISGLRNLKVDEEEAEEIIVVPVQALLDKSRWRQETEMVNGEEVPMYFFQYGDNVIWGATARILNQFLDILTQVMEDK